MNNIGLKFRNAANDGNIKAMCDLYKMPGLKVAEAGSKTQKTAAHRAAEKGNASVLRLLHNWGDTFQAVDLDGKTPSDLATDLECIELFELIKLGKKAVDVARQVFPYYPNPLLQEDLRKPLVQSHYQFRKKFKEAVAAEQCEIDNMVPQALAVDANNIKITPALFTELRDRYVKKAQMMQNIYNHLHCFDHAKKMNQAYGQCGELSAVAFYYLASILKIQKFVELISSERMKNGQLEWDHVFVVLNRNNNIPAIEQESWKGALAVDPLEGKTIFLEHLDRLEENLMVKKCKEIGYIHFCDNHHLLNPPDIKKNGNSDSLYHTKLNDLFKIVALKLEELIDYKSNHNSDETHAIQSGVCLAIDPI